MANIKPFAALRPQPELAGRICELPYDVMSSDEARTMVGWAMSERMTAKLVCDALQMALWRRKRPEGVVVHSDRGSQYCSHEYQRLLSAHGLVCSMSKKGDW